MSCINTLKCLKNVDRQLVIFNKKNKGLIQVGYKLNSISFLPNVCVCDGIVSRVCFLVWVVGAWWLRNESQPYCLISKYKFGAWEVAFELLRVTCKPVTLQRFCQKWAWPGARSLFKMGAGRFWLWKVSKPLTPPWGCLIVVSDLSSPKLISSESAPLVASPASVAQDRKTLLRIFLDTSFSNSPHSVCQRILSALPLKWIQNPTAYHYLPGPRHPILCLDNCSRHLAGACFHSDLSTL